LKTQWQNTKSRFILDSNDPAYLSHCRVIS
jgi:hypothetical protein